MTNMLQLPTDPHVDEATWQAWLKKNQVQDRFRFERRLRVFGLVAVFVTVSALLWTFAR